MVLKEASKFEDNQEPLELAELPRPTPEANEVLLRVSVCGICHTEWDQIEGRIASSLPVVPGHQVVGYVEERGDQVKNVSPGERMGVAWIYSACGRCKFCREGRENLCRKFKATGSDADGGYAEYMAVPEDYAYSLPADYRDEQVAPWLCAGAIGYRSLRLTGISNGQKLGLTGFGASGHLVLKMARVKYPDTDVYVFARNPRQREFAEELGAVWAGDTADESPEKLRGIIDTTPAWKPVVEALKNLDRGGRLVINAIRKEAGDKDYLAKLDYPEHLWLEKEIKSVANVTRRDVREFLELAGEMALEPEVQEFPLEEANKALAELKESKIRGAKVLRVSGGEDS